MKTTTEKSGMLRMLIVWVFATLALGWSAQAAVTLDQHQDTISARTNVGFFPGDGVNYKAAQSITPILKFIDKVVFTGDNVPTGGVSAFTLDVWGTPVDNGAPETGTLLATKAIAIAANGDWTFDFSATPIDATGYDASTGPGRIVFVLSAIDGIRDQDFTPFMAVPSAYSGQMWVQNTLAQTWSAPVNSDLVFQEFGHDAVPEPTIVMLMAGGGLILAAPRRRRQRVVGAYCRKMD